MTEDSGVHISDSVVMGDVQQNITNIQQSVTSGESCPSCEARNVVIMKCRETDCNTHFCELCHGDCRYENQQVFKFNSGLGLGPYCSNCIDIKINHEKEESIRIIEEKRRQDDAAAKKELEVAKKAAADAESRRITEEKRRVSEQARRDMQWREEWAEMSATEKTVERAYSLLFMAQLALIGYFWGGIICNIFLGELGFSFYFPIPGHSDFGDPFIGNEDANFFLTFLVYHGVIFIPAILLVCLKEGLEACETKVGRFVFFIGYLSTLFFVGVVII